MENHEFTNENIRIIEVNNNIEFYVRTITWYSPFEFFNIWVKVENKCLPLSPNEIIAVVDEIINNRKFFIFCKECNKPTLIGNSNDHVICNGCSSVKHGIVY